MLVPRTFLVGIGLLACTMAGAAVIWIMRLGAAANAIVPAAVLAGLVAVAVHGVRVDRQARPDD